MKSILMALFLIASTQTALAGFYCEPVAEVNADVERSEVLNDRFCKVYVKTSGYRYFGTPSNCSINLSDIATRGVVTGMTVDKQCPTVLNASVEVHSSGEYIMNGLIGY